jgi:HAD superfamily hydrolase (TIGR01509 family)
MRPFNVKAVLLDFDGTISKPGSLDFKSIKMELGCPLDRPVLEWIEGQEKDDVRVWAMDRLEAFECKGAETSSPNDGAEEAVRYLKAMGLGVGLISRNSLSSIHRALENFNRLSPRDFDIIITRDDPLPPKPSPAGIRFAAQKMGVEVCELLVVGDFIFDIEAGRQAGALTIFLTNGKEVDVPKSDFTISRLNDLQDVVRMGLPLNTGKLPNDLLVQFLEEFTFEDESILIGPGMGEDTAAIDVQDAQVLIVTSDPITYATDAIGYYGVIVNANDMATSGAVPRWLITTLLFPRGTTPSQIYRTMEELKEACDKWNITPCGGHTEITDAVSRTIIIGTMAGTVKKDGLIDKSRMRPGDKILMTKGAGLEGTAILAREFRERLMGLGLSEEFIDRSAALLSQISIMEEAAVAASHRGTSAMHDVTEGGVATAMRELGAAGGNGIRVDLDAIPVREETARICELLGINPLGLIGSGSLLISCRSEHYADLMKAIESRGISITLIGEVLESASGVQAFGSRGPQDLPFFDVDEITRFFNTRSGL